MFNFFISDKIKLLADNMRNNYKDWTVCGDKLLKDGKNGNLFCFVIYEGIDKDHLITIPKFGFSRREEKFLIKAVKDCMALIAVNQE